MVVVASMIDRELDAVVDKEHVWDRVTSLEGDMSGSVDLSMRRAGSCRTRDCSGIHKICGCDRVSGLLIGMGVLIFT